jgi:Zn-dependent protease with chaperone function
VDFFEHQEQARKKSGVLVFYFVLAVIGIVASIYFVAVLVSGWQGERYQLRSLWNPGIFVPSAIGTLAVILLGSGYKIMQLSGGGAVVAKDLGGRRVDQRTTDFEERKLLNVVEEMAIAAGMPVPEVYVMDNEEGINAFAAGRTPSDAVIGVTRGTIKFLSRDELQGVIAHEFSHILNGDMRLNMRLIGLLFGILFIAMIGQMMMRGAANTARYSRSREGGGGALAFLVIGVAVMAIGYIGLFFGKLIKAAVSRQREYLADASAVQFTRNPDGIAGALRKIGGLTQRSSLNTAMAEEASHMFFGDCKLRSSVSAALATHPPLDVRIKKIDAAWDGKFPKVTLPDISSGREEVGAKGGKRSTGGGHSAFPLPGFPQSEHGGILGLTEAQAFQSMSNLHGEQVELGENIHAGMPAKWLEAAHSEAGAQALVFALLLAQDDNLRAQELQRLSEATDPATYQETVELHSAFADLHSSIKLALIDLAIPTLKRLGASEYTRFHDIKQQLIASDQQVDLFEFTLLKIIDRYLVQQSPPRIKYRQIDALHSEASVLITTLAQLGSRDADQVAAAFRAGSSLIQEETGRPLTSKSAGECGLGQIDEALKKFERSTPLVKKRLLFAAGKTVMADQVLTSDEAELIRAIADAIGCPIPPFVKTQAEAA